VIRKLTILGGSSPNAPEIIPDLQHRGVPCEEICLVSRNGQLLQAVGGFSRRLAADIGYQVRVTETTDVTTGLSGATAVVNLIRVGGRDTRDRLAHITRAFGISGHAAHNIGVMTNMPQILDYGTVMLEVCPGAPLIEFTNPCGIHAEAFARRLPGVPIITACPAPARERNAIGALLGIPPEETEADDFEMSWFGFNHLAWIPMVTRGGTDVTAEVDRRDGISIRPRFKRGWYAELGVIPAKLAGSAFTRAEAAGNPEEEAASFRPDPTEQEKRDTLYAAFEENSRRPVEMLRAKGRVDWYRLAIVPILEGLFTNTERRTYASAPVDLALPEFPGLTVECGVSVTREGLVPIGLPQPPAAIVALARLLRASETLMIEAAVEHSRSALVESLVASPACMEPVMAGRFADCLDRELELGLRR